MLILCLLKTVTTPFYEMYIHKFDQIISLKE